METLINMSLLGDVDHTLVKAPYFKLTKRMGYVCVYDIRMLQPNEGVYFSTSTMHSIEHMLAVALNEILPTEFVNLAPLGCRTGFYLTTTDLSPELMGEYLVKAIEHALTFTEVPLANKFNCGNCIDHNLAFAKLVLQNYLDCRSQWAEVMA